MMIKGILLSFQHKHKLYANHKSTDSPVLP